MKFKLKFVGPVTEASEDRIEQLPLSKLFGIPIFPSDFIAKEGLHLFYFVGQVNLEQVKGKQNLLPSHGMLYFFLRFLRKDITAKVVYTKEELVEAVMDMNIGFKAMNFKGALYMDFDEEGPHQFLSENQEDDTLSENEIILLQIDLSATHKRFPALQEESKKMQFVISKEALKRLDFRKVKLVLR